MQYFVSDDGALFEVGEFTVKGVDTGVVHLTLVEILGVALRPILGGRKGTRAKFVANDGTVVRGFVTVEVY